MNKEEYRKHCEEQIERCIILNDKKHLREHELSLALLNENESLIEQRVQLQEKTRKYDKLTNSYNNVLNNKLRENIDPDSEDFYLAEIESKANKCDELEKWLIEKLDPSNYIGGCDCYTTEMLSIKKNIYKEVLNKMKGIEENSYD